jgi:hypothetical protein
MNPFADPPRPTPKALDTLERLAQALWEVVPYDRMSKWEDATEATRYHYRARAARLLEDYDIEPRWLGTKQPIRTPDDFEEHYEKDVLLWGSVLVRIPKPAPTGEFFAAQDLDDDDD